MREIEQNREKKTGSKSRELQKDRYTETDRQIDEHTETKSEMNVECFNIFLRLVH